MSRHVLVVLVPQVTCKDNGTCLSSVGWSGSDAHLLQTRAFVAIAFQVSCHALCAIRNPGRLSVARVAPDEDVALTVPAQVMIMLVAGATSVFGGWFSSRFAPRLFTAHAPTTLPPRAPSPKRRATLKVA